MRRGPSRLISPLLVTLPTNDTRDNCTTARTAISLGTSIAAEVGWTGSLEHTGGAITDDNETRFAAEIVDTWGEQNSADLEELVTAAINIVEKVGLKIRRSDTLKVSCTQK